MFKIIIFAVVSAVIVYSSWASLLNPRSHGFYRFFAWEAILVMILLNLDYWFDVPYSIPQIISWLLLSVCSFLVIHGALLLRSVGKPDRQRKDPALMGIEKTTQLVTVGAYRYIRHPIYSSLLFLTWGVFFKHPSWAAILLAVVSTFFLTMTAKIEEAENISFFGTAYERYMEKTKMFIPYLF